jgi:predicted ATPase
MKAYNGLNESRMILAEVQKVRSQIKEIQSQSKNNAIIEATKQLNNKAGGIEGTAALRRVRRPAMTPVPGLREMSVQLRSLLDLLQESDAIPTSQATAALENVWKSFSLLRTQWMETKAKDLKALNNKLVKSGLSPISY